MSRITPLIAGGLASALTLAACGGGDDGVTRAEFIASADDICVDYDEKLDALFDRDLEEGDFDGLADLFAEAETIGAEGVEALEALELPEDGADEAQAFFDLMSAQIDTMGEAQEAARAADEAALGEVLDEGGERDEEIERAARDFGFEECGIGDESEDEVPIGDEDAPAGGEDEGAAAPTREEYIATTDALCADAQVQAESIPADENQIAALIDLGEQLVADFGAVPVPEGDEEVIADLEALFDEQLVLLQDLAAAAEAGDQATFDAVLAQVGELEAEADVLASDYGFEECGRAEA